MYIFVQEYLPKRSSGKNMHRQDAHDPISLRMCEIIGELTGDRHRHSRKSISERYFTIRIPREGRFIWVVGRDSDWIFPETDLAGPDTSWLGSAFFDEDRCPILSDRYECAFFLADPPSDSLEPIHKSTAATIIRSWMRKDIQGDGPCLSE